MLDFMRRHARNWLVKVLLGIIIVVFIFYFGSLGERQKTQTLAVLDGKQISMADYYKEYEQLINSYRRMAGGTLTDEILKKLNLKKQAMDSIVDRVIIMHEAGKQHIQVTNEEIRGIITSIPVFQRNGVFDEELYRQALRYENMKPEDFEVMQKQSLIVMKFKDLLQEGAKVSDKELHDYYIMTNERINVELVSLNPDDYMSSVNPSASDLEKYLKDHGSEFRVPEQVQVKYLAFTPSNYSRSITISESDIRDYYDRNKKKFAKRDGKTPDISQVRGEIVSELKHREGMASASQEAKKAHDSIYQNENFDAYAAQAGLQINQTNLFTSVNVPEIFRSIPDVDKTIFGLMKDEISSVLSTDKGYYLLKLTARKSPYVPSLQEIRTEIQKRYTAKESNTLCRKAADTLLEQLKKGEPLSKGGNRKIVVNETGFFQINNGIPNLGANRELTDTLYSLSGKKPYTDKVFFVNGKYWIIKFKDREKLDDTDFASKREAIRQQLLSMKKSEIFHTWLEGTKHAMIQDGRLKLKRDVKDL